MTYQNFQNDSTYRLKNKTSKEKKLLVVAEKWAFFEKVITFGLFERFQKYECHSTTIFLDYRVPNFKFFKKESPTNINIIA